MPPRVSPCNRTSSSKFLWGMLAVEVALLLVYTFLIFFYRSRRQPLVELVIALFFLCCCCDLCLRSWGLSGGITRLGGVCLLLASRSS